MKIFAVCVTVIFGVLRFFVGSPLTYTDMYGVLANIWIGALLTIIFGEHVTPDSRKLAGVLLVVACLGELAHTWSSYAG